MEDTGFSVPPEKSSRFANCYAYTENNPLKLNDRAADTRYTPEKVKTFSGGGGLVSTLSDYFQLFFGFF